ncbi:amidohydrolase [Robiginitalea sp. SC105]|uniref:amidohydrolase n=1 Tax=Robiginitalea sp. SC105 TaxID=2762332 RepID=UPI00163A0EDD|nr:amidohydrolase [Robiginitalea sp. SC105]MBC2838610.1 amidohydrolase [Robiginitalea sp. SC105]
MTIDKLKVLRKELHRYPELSGHEKETAGRIRKFIAAHHNAEVIENIGGNGLAVVYTYSASGPTIVIRCELDALPIEEANDFEHRSRNEGVSHKCGHDGHMAILAGLAFWLNDQDFGSGKVVLLFQPAEETGAGAPGVLNDARFTGLNPDYIFALHNIPGQPLHSVITLKDSFSATVQSVAIRLKGVESHSAEPEHGVNPALCMAELTQKIDRLNINDASRGDFRLCVPIYSNMGVQSYGISAGFGEIHYTLRTKTSAKMERLKEDLDHILREVCPKHQLPYSVNWFEYFPAVVNDGFCNQAIREAADTCKLEVIEKGAAFKFGEDFGWFSEKYQAAMFGLGAGLESPALHQADYDFPDELIETGMAMFRGIIKNILTNR